MLAIKKAGMAPGKLAPKEITERLENKVGMYDRLPKPTFEASWAILHLGYGSTSEVVYALTQEGAPGLERRGLVGPLFGVLLWTIGYCGRPPGFGLYPPPTRLSQRKIGAELLTTYLIYGTATAAMCRTLQASKSERKRHSLPTGHRAVPFVGALALLGLRPFLAYITLLRNAKGGG